MFNFNFLARKEKFFILDVSPERASGVVMTLDAEKKIKLEKRRDYPERQGLRGALPFPRLQGKIIVCVNPEFACKQFIPLVLERERGAGVLEKVEFENLLAQAVGKLFNQCRRDAGKELGVDEIDVIVADSRVGNFRIDGHRAMSPLGFQTERIHAVLEMTFTTREIFSRAKEFLPAHGEFFFTEREQAELIALGIVKAGRIGLLAAGAEKSRFFLLDRTPAGPTVSRHTVLWGVRAFADILAKELLVGATAAQRLYRSYLQGEVSEGVQRHFERRFRPEIDSLFKAIRKFEPSGGVYIEGDDVPFALLAKRSKMFSKPPFEAFLETSGFSIESKDKSMERDLLFRTLAPFFEFYYDKSDTTINHWLKRRLHWLGSAI